MVSISGLARHPGERADDSDKAALATAQKQAADAEAARQKAEADAETARKSVSVNFSNQPQTTPSPDLSAGTEVGKNAVFPKYYTVGKWPRECFWEIAKLVYGDPRHWRVLYEVNRSKLPAPENPDLLITGVVLEIPSINGEQREGNYTEQRNALQ
jgi:nucleoid-associated protein YgaU